MNRAPLLGMSRSPNATFRVYRGATVVAPDRPSTCAQAAGPEMPQIVATTLAASHAPRI
jgi:hypothetical protein